ncbi:hypothetical protein CLERM_050 [Coxiella-like endosymbiont]|nr:hypothetical protein CLERM_050 [Coxiella-like endosymbiont]
MNNKGSVIDTTEEGRWFQSAAVFGKKAAEKNLVRQNRMATLC